MEKLCEQVIPCNPIDSCIQQLFPVFVKPFNASQSISLRTPARDKWQIVLSVRRTFKQYKLLESSAAEFGDALNSEFPEKLI